MGTAFRYDRRFRLDVDAAELWRVLEQTDRYVEWWSWLDSLEGGGLAPGRASACVVRAPLPYSLRFTVHVERVEPRRTVLTRVAGDLEGPARLEIGERTPGCEARLSWELELRDRMLRPLSTVARPAMRWAHDRVIAVGLAEFRRRALDGGGQR